MSLFQSILTSADAVNCKFSRKCELIRKSTAGYQSHFDKLWDGGSNTQYSFNLEHHWRYFYLVRFSFWPCLHGKPWNFTGQTNRDTTASGTTESKNYDPSPWIQTVESLEIPDEALQAPSSCQTAEAEYQTWYLEAVQPNTTSVRHNTKATCVMSDTSSSSETPDKVILVWQKRQNSVDEVKYSETWVRCRVSLLGNLKGVLDPLVPGVTAGWRQRQGRRGGRGLWDSSRLLLLLLLFYFIILLLRVSIISREGGVRQQRGALVLLDGLAERPQLAQQRHVELPQADLVHNNTKHPGSDDRRGNFSVNVHNLSSHHDNWSTSETLKHFWCGGQTLASGLWVNSCLKTGLFKTQNGCCAIFFAEQRSVLFCVEAHRKTDERLSVI